MYIYISNTHRLEQTEKYSDYKHILILTLLATPLGPSITQ